MQFMLDALQDLRKALNQRLAFFHSRKEDNSDVLSGLVAALPNLKAIYFNADITPFAKQRDAGIAKWCAKNGIDCHAIDGDYTLLGGNHADRQPYQVFTAFYKRYHDAATMPVSPAAAGPGPRALRIPGALNLSAAALESRYLPEGRNPNMARQGGREAALAILDRIRKGDFKNYEVDRDYPGKDATTHLSAYLKFGCCSIREAYAAVVSAHSQNHGLVKQFFWREFYDQLAVHMPRVLQGQSQRPAYDAVRWGNNKAWFQAWKEGRTGFPLVDAGMRQLVQTGELHNRMRMVVASFLIKDLHVDWRWGEKFFAQMLLDYSPTANNGGWQWTAGSGADAQPYYRIFNPWLQSKRWDSDASYIKRWIPELKAVPAKDLHAWNLRLQSHPAVKYPAPMIDHATQAAAGKKIVMGSVTKI